jgi:thermitase
MRRSRSVYTFLVAIILGAALAAPAANAAPGGPPPKGYEAGELLVKLSLGINAQTFARRFGLRAEPSTIAQLPSHPIYRFEIADGTAPPDKAAALASQPGVIYVEPNYDGQIPEVRQRSSWVVGGSAEEYVAQWAPARIRLPEAHTVTRGAGVTIAILDTGADLTHPALAAQLVAGYDFVDQDDDPSEVGAYREDSAFGHGTHVAGLVALAAPQAKIMPLRTLKPDGTGDIWTQVTALRYAMEHGADVINLSYSFGQQSKVFDEIVAEMTCTAPVDFDCRAKIRPGAVVIAAAGNSGASIREYPAADHVSGLLAVAASTESDTLAAFSTYGSWVGVAAPGDRVLSSIPGGDYATWSGTSMAAPLVAGVIALTRAAYPGLRPTETVTRVATTAARIRADVPRRVDAAGAVGWAALK